jgi:hypothetical protein
MSALFQYGGKLFVMRAPPGSWRYDWALWQPVVRKFWFLWPRGKEFWLDMHGFEPVNAEARAAIAKATGEA